MQALIIEVEGGWGIGPIEWKDPDMDFTGDFVEESFTMDMDRGEEMYTRFHNVTKAHHGLKVSTVPLKVHRLIRIIKKLTMS